MYAATSASNAAASIRRAPSRTISSSNDPPEAGAPSRASPSWLTWPAETGYAPSLDVLATLAELYECSIADLLSDSADFRSRIRPIEHAPTDS
jgi:hypothetical protein